jgi:probable F420-dependent oxidoreductase
MQLGASMPIGDIGPARAAVRDYAQAAESFGYDYLLAPDHVLGKNPHAKLVHSDNTGVPAEHAQRAGTSAVAWHDPFVMFGFLAGCTTRIGFATGVLVLPQRQAALVAKQAACLDVLCGGRFRLGVGVGWNEVEFVALNEDFHTRGKRSAEQVQVMQALWAQDHVSFQGAYHRIEDAGINPRPATGRVPVWFGGHAEATFQRAARYGDGFMPLDYPPREAAVAAFDKLRRLTEQAGRDPDAMGIEVWMSPGAGSEADWRREITFWKQARVTHVTAHTTFISEHHARVAGRTAADHLAALTRFRAAVADLL